MPRKFSHGEIVIFKYGNLQGFPHKKESLQENQRYLGYNKKHKLYFYDLKVNDAGRKGIIESFVAEGNDIELYRVKDNRQFMSFYATSMGLKKVKNEEI